MPCRQKNVLRLFLNRSLNYNTQLVEEKTVPKDTPVLEPDHQTAIPRNWLANYLPMGISQILSIFGSSIVQFAMIWYLTEQTGSATFLAMASFVGQIPQVLLGPFAGALVDRWNRKLVMLFSDGLVALVTLVLIFLFAIEQIRAWHILIVLFLRSLFGSFQYPAMRASVSLMIPKEHLARLGGINQAVYGLLNIVSPPLGALLISRWKMHEVMMVDVVTAGLAIVLLMLVRVPQPAAPAVKKPLTPASLLDDVRAGLRYAWQWSGMFKLLIMAALLNMVMAPPGSLLPLLISKVYGRGAADLAVVESAFGIGVVVGGVLLGVWGGFKRRVYTVMMGITGMGLGVMMIALAGREQFNLVVLGMGLMGLLNAFANGPLGAIVQTKVAPEMQGRVFTVMSSLAGMAAPIGMLFAGPLADRIGIQPMYLIGALACTGIGVAGFLLPDVRTLDSQEPGGPDGDLAAQTGSGS